jgi:hypothetical protein
VLRLWRYPQWAPWELCSEFGPAASANIRARVDQIVDDNEVCIYPPIDPEEKPRGVDSDCWMTGIEGKDRRYGRSYPVVKCCC